MLTADQMISAITRLAPAEAAVHHDHPNLWSWRSLTDSASADTRYVAIFVQHLDDPAVDEHDVKFRERLESR